MGEETKERGERGCERISLFFVAKRSRITLVCSSRTGIGILAIAPSHKRVVRDKREPTYNGIDEAIILRANEHYCQRDVDKNGRANHKIPCGLWTQSGPAFRKWKKS